MISTVPTSPIFCVLGDLTNISMEKQVIHASHFSMQHQENYPRELEN